MFLKGTIFMRVLGKDLGVSTNFWLTQCLAYNVCLLLPQGSNLHGMCFPPAPHSPPPGVSIPGAPLTEESCVSLGTLTEKPVFQVGHFTTGLLLSLD